jgi:hypothetical protein
MESPISVEISPEIRAWIPIPGDNRGLGPWWLFYAAAFLATCEIRIRSGFDSFNTLRTDV